MSKNKKVNSPFHLYEGRIYNDKHVRMTHDMLQDETFRSLKYTSQVLYLYMKDWSCGEIEFKYSWRLASRVLRSKPTYQSAKKELIEKGFIICTRTCKCSSEPNHYKFSNDWSKR